MNDEILKTLRISLAAARAEIKLRNEGSYLGVLWYLLNPLLMFLLLAAIFFPRLGQKIPHYSLYLLLGIILFNLFQQVTTEAIKTIRQNNRLIKSVTFPRESLVIAILWKALFAHFWEIILLIAVALFWGAPIGGILFYPLILVFFCLFCLGAALLLSCVTIYFLDLENIWAFAVRLIWFGTPIFYAIGGQDRLFLINLFNPVYYFMTIARDVVIYSRPPQLWMAGGAACYAILFFMIGREVFNRLKIKFAEMI